MLLNTPSGGDNMRRILIILSLLMFCVSIVNAQTPKIGFGAFGGMNIPVLQDDQGNGSVFGLKARLKVIPIVILEPNIIFGKWGAPDPMDGIDLGIDGSKITSYGIDAVLGAAPGNVGIKPYFHAGIGIYSIKNDDTGFDESKLGYSGGLGLAIGIGHNIDIDFSGKAIFAPQDPAGAKKAVLILGD